MPPQSTSDDMSCQWRWNNVPGRAAFILVNFSSWHTLPMVVRPIGRRYGLRQRHPSGMVTCAIFGTSVHVEMYVIFLPESFFLPPTWHGMHSGNKTLCPVVLWLSITHYTFPSCMFHYCVALFCGKLLWRMGRSDFSSHVGGNTMTIKCHDDGSGERAVMILLSNTMPCETKYDPAKYSGRCRRSFCVVVVVSNLPSQRGSGACLSRRLSCLLPFYNRLCYHTLYKNTIWPLSRFRLLHYECSARKCWFSVGGQILQSTTWGESVQQRDWTARR